MSYVLFDILFVFLFDAIFLQEHCTYYQRSVFFLSRNHFDQSRILPLPTFMFMFKLDPTIQPTTIPLSLFGRIKVQKGRVWKF